MSNQNRCLMSNNMMILVKKTIDNSAVFIVHIIILFYEVDKMLRCKNVKTCRLNTCYLHIVSSAL